MIIFELSFDKLHTLHMYQAYNIDTTFLLLRFFELIMCEFRMTSYMQLEAIDHRYLSLDFL